jgi:hypothetical protein
MTAALQEGNLLGFLLGCLLCFLLGFFRFTGDHSAAAGCDARNHTTKA